MANQMEGRVRDLEARVAKLEQLLAAKAEAPAAPAAEAAQEQPVVAAQPAAEAA